MSISLACDASIGELLHLQCTHGATSLCFIEHAISLAVKWPLETDGTYIHSKVSVLSAEGTDMGSVSLVKKEGKHT